MTNDPVELMVAPMHFAVGRLLDGDGFAGDHGLVDGAAAFEDDAIDGNFFSGTDAQFVAGLDVFEWDVFLANVASRCRQ